MQGSEQTAPSLRHRMSAPLTVAAAAGLATAYLAVRSPEEPGHYPVCPLLAVTDLYCPGCGSLRALHALTQGEFGTAIDRNVLTTAAVPLAVLAWLAWIRRRAIDGPPSSRRFPASMWWTLAAVVLAFAVLRNTGPGAWLAP